MWSLAGSDPTTVGTRAEFAAAFTRVREAAGLSVRELARRLGVPAGTLGDYFGGRHVPSVNQQGVIEAALRECGVPDDAIGDWLDALRRARRSSDGRTAPRRAPYRGLERFEPEDVDLFFGRAELTATVVERLSALAADPGPSRGLLAVVGPSGAGKSSVLRAGVVASVREGALGAGWTCRIATPAADRLLELGELPPRDEPGRRIVVLDQFEEVFTYGGAGPAGSAERARLLERLVTPEPGGNHDLVVLGMRADFYAEAAREPVLLAALQHAQVVVGPMTEDDVRAAIIGPAEHVGMTVDDGVVELVLADADPHDASGFPHDVGALPLLSHALLATWERSTGRRMTVADYRATGGLGGAIQRTAEQLYTELTPGERDVTRRLFLRLVHVDGETAVTRRRATPEELEALAGDADRSTAPTARSVLERFVEHRLVTVTSTSVEISHEALLGAWPRLRSWIDADRAGLRLHRRLTDTANAWVDADRDPALLLREGRLEAAADWAGERDNRRSLNDTERELLAASLTARDRERLTARRRTRRLTQLLAAVAVLALVATVLAVFARRAQQRADAATADARTSRDQARSRQLAIQARQLTGADPALAQQLAVAAYRISPTVEARSALLDSSTTPVITRQLGSGGPTALAVRPDGRLLAVGDAATGAVRLRRADTTMPQLGVLPGRPGAQIYALRFSPDGTLLAVAGQSSTVALWDVRVPARPHRLAVLPTHFTQATESVLFSADGHELLAAGTGPLRMWDLHPASAPRQVPAPPGVGARTVVQALDLDPHGRLAAGTLDGTVLLWTGTGDRRAPRRLTAGGEVNTVHFSAGDALAAGDRTGHTTVWTLAGSRVVLRHRLVNPSGSEINALAWSADGRTLVLGSADNSVQTWDTGTWTERSSLPHPGPITGIAFVAGDRRLVSTAADGAVRQWAAAGPGYAAPSGSVFSVAFDHAGRTLLVARNGSTGGVQLWHTGAAPSVEGPLMQLPGLDPNDGTGALRVDGGLVAAANGAGRVGLWRTAVTRPRPAAHPFTAATALVESLAISPDGRVLAVAGDDSYVHLWSIADPARPRSLAGVHGRDEMLGVTFSPDGSLIAGSDVDKHVYVWNVRTPSRPRLVAAVGALPNYAWGAAFSPNGRVLAVAGADHTVRLFAVSRSDRMTPLGKPLTGPADYVNVPAFSPDGRLLAAPSNDHSVWVWDVSRPSAPVRYAQLQALAGNAFTAAFSPDGRTLVAGGRSTSVPAWTVDPARAIRRECGAAGAPVTRAEWAQYVPGVAYSPPCP